MKKSIAILCAAASLSLGSAADAQKLTASDFFAPKEYPQTVSFPGGVTMTSMTYSVLPGYRPLTVDIYRPADNQAHPGLVFFHGGSFVGGDTRFDPPFGNFPGVLAALAAHGYVVASADYRLANEAQFPAALQDVKTAIRFLRAHAQELNLDQAHIAAWGASAGGYLAVMAGVTCGVASLEPPAPNASQPPRPQPSDCIQAVVDWSGFLVLDHILSDAGKPAPATSQEGMFLGCEPKDCPDGLLRAANPMTYVSAKTPPMLIQHGDLDTTLAVKQPKELAAALRAKNVPVQFVTYPGVGHMFIGQDRKGDPVQDQAVLDKMVAFLDATFPQK
jgi:acetyl esterase/lipase